MRVKLIGKQHREGTSSKTGKPYDINILHCVGTSKAVEGQSVMTVTVDGKEYPYASLRLNADYAVDYDAGGNLLDFAALDSGK